MASNLSVAIRNKSIYCTICNQTMVQWRDFTLQKGHIYGYSPFFQRNGRNGFFVVHQVQKDILSVYVSRTTRDQYVWELRTYIPFKHDGTFLNETMRRIWDVNAKRVGGVELVDNTYNIDGIVETKLVTGEFMPMPRMSIPMGNRGIRRLASVSKSRNFNYSSFDEGKRKTIDLYTERCDRVIKAYERREQIGDSLVEMVNMLCEI